jgi:hypothetical protein
MRVIGQRHSSTRLTQRLGVEPIIGTGKALRLPMLVLIFIQQT